MNESTSARCLPPIDVIGIGDDGPRGLPEAARRLAESADVLCGGRRHLDLFPVGQERRFAITRDLQGLATAIAEARVAGLHIAVLSSGDPLFFGIGAFLSEQFGAAALRVTSHVSSVQVAFARLAVPWQDAVVLSAHGRQLPAILGRAAAAAKAAILTDDENSPSAIARALLDLGIEDADAAVCEHLDGAEERVVRAPLSVIAGQSFARLNVMVVLRDPSVVRWGRPRVGLPDDDYAHSRGMITKAEVRAVTLSRLRPAGTRVVWDIGAGSGSVAIEAASLDLDTAVFAVERDPAQIALARKNVRRFHAGNVRLVEGEAPGALIALPDPDAVFIGGAGGRLPAILDAVGRRLRPGGRLVLNLVTFAHLATAQAWLDTRGWPASVTQVAIARSQPIGGSSRLASLNPVFVVVAERR